MSDMEISKVLAQMRALSAEIRRPVLPDAAAPGTVKFGEVMRNAIDGVNQQQAAANDLVTKFETGAADVSVAEVMISMQKASLSFQAMTEVRNRLVEAYQQVMNMPI
jgi:flagellar hook-basal body complex protein FliE